MSDEQVDLNALIQNDRRRHHFDREKRREEKRSQRNYRDEQRDHDRRDRSRDNRRNRDQRDNRSDRRDKPKRYKQKQLVLESYAIHARGFVSDVSLDDILKLAKGKQIINIKAFLDREDGQPLEPSKDTSMTVIINFVTKEEADQFIKEYADKKLDGKTPLQFQFRRGIVLRKPKNQQVIKNEEQDQNKQSND